VSSDRARISFDPSRRWRGVVSQQGRVTLEADVNEAAAIDAAERRARLLELVGPSGTPDDGYKVLPGGSGAVAGDLAVQAGTMYVGGERVALVAALDYGAQPDWLDSAGDPLWVAPAVPAAATELVYLLLREQEVGAVEDPALLDIALGGPDTAARSRIVQRVVRAATTAVDGHSAQTALAQAWAGQGLTLDPATMRLSSPATLQVGFAQAPGVATLCQPSGQGGYVGAQNQLIRVQVAALGSDGAPTLVWGYDNASFLYRIAGPVSAGATTITLAGTPVDSYHQPATNQAVEILEAAATLSPGETAGYIAAATGSVTTLAQPYDPTSGTVGLATGLTAAQATSPLLFLRVWQETIAYSSGPVALGDTGLTVTLATTGSTWHLGDHWTFAVRPGTPTTLSPVYPERLLASPQPPDGPAMWACALGLVSWQGATPQVTDLRHTFDDLVTLTEQANGCCAVEVTPDLVDGGATLQALVDSVASVGPATICFGPGTYALPSPLIIQAGASALTLEACMGGVVIEAAENSAPFTLGLIAAAPAASTTTTTVTQIENVAPLTIRGLELSMPPVAFPYSDSAIGGLPSQRQALLTEFGNGLQVAFGISILGCSNVTIEQCRFYFPDVGAATNLFAAGIYATAATAGVEVSGCSFINVPEPIAVPFSDMRLGTLAAPPYQVCFGYLQMPTQPPAATPSTTATSVSGPEAIPISRDLATAIWRDASVGAQGQTFAAPSVTERPPASQPARPATAPEAVEPGAALPLPINTVPILTSLPILTTRPILTTAPLQTTATTATTTTATTTTTPATTAPASTTTPGPAQPLTLTNAVLEDATFTRNTFDGITVPVLVLGAIGAVSVTDNTVRACYGGFWFVPADGDTAVALLDLLDPSDSAASSYAAEYGITAVTDPVLWLGSALARLLPLTPPTAPLVLRPIALPSSIITSASGLLQTLAAAPTTTTTTTTPAGTPPPTAAAAEPELAKEISTETAIDIEREGIDPTLEEGRAGLGVVDTLSGETGASLIDRLPRQVLHLPTFTDLLPSAGPTSLAAAPILTAEMGLGATPRIDVHGNEVEAVVEATYSGSGLLVAVMLSDGTIATVLCNGNRIRGRVASGPTVSLNQVTQCTLTGNLISNEIVDPAASASPEPSIPPDTTAAGTTAPPATSPSLVLVPALLTTPVPASGAAPVATALVAVTGNVLVGDPPTLPTRPPGLPAGFTVWDVLNTIVGYVAPATTTTTTTTTTGPS
jgi:hypothetical protein